ncbi:DUF5689 domain-containing protein [Myroides phaeus]|uniref:DUF5689 domain-containing protein n=1 Tax=Myroides phaeus TaxID=702745 RepID=UPI002DB8892B|nr:DUF5689 domain-containing protein [Myroides phaeus]MEC4115771.1 DUF5689 domain-containing protein [Myroides phaeus]
MKTILKITAFLLVYAYILTACAKNDDFITPTTECTEPSVVANKTIDALYSKISEGKEVQFYKADEITSGIVISSDQGGNFYQQLIIVDEKTQTPLTIKVDVKGGYALYPVGSKVFIDLNGLYVQNNYSMMTFGGGIYTAASGNKYPDIITAGKLKTTIYKSCTTLTEKDFDVFINEVTIPQILEDKKLIGKLIRINNIQFDRSIVGETYYDEGAPTNDRQGYTLRMMHDAEGNSIQVRTGQYTNGLKDEIIAKESGSVTGIISEFQGVLQFYPRTINDMNLTLDPFESVIKPPTTNPTPGGKEGVNSDGVNQNTPHYIANFNNWSSFIKTTNKLGLQRYATEAQGKGKEGKTTLSIKGTPTANDYVFIVENQTVNTKAKNISMYVKGNTEKSLSFNVYREDGTYAVFNLASDEVIKSKEKPFYNRSLKLQPTSRTNSANKSNGYNDYVSAMIAAPEWIKITLDLTNVDYNKSGKGNLFALKVGSKAAYDLLISEIVLDEEEHEEEIINEPEDPINKDNYLPTLPNNVQVTEEQIYLNLINEIEAKKTINSKWISKSIAQLETTTDAIHIIKVEYEKNNTILFTTQGSQKLKYKQRLSFFIRGKSTTRAINIDLIMKNGDKRLYKLYSPEDGENIIIIEQLKGTNNYNHFNIDTQGQWLKVSIDISDIETTKDKDVLTLRLGGTTKAVPFNKWDLEISSFFLE